MLYVPFVLFVILLVAGCRELGPSGVMGWIALCCAMVVGGLLLEAPWYAFVAAFALVDAILLMVVVGGDVRIR